ncbi:adrenocortical dysplasia protein homolog [Thunnus maccoyii]|uniref:adrenocortical dysplasia protein homolog n=1 Tax=Thunnus maccoyii TaxID=8240 RepID=UPI001C4D92B4|nr:adrenocortical dysplasia protein homolog [Thunnus maccoyii]
MPRPARSRLSPWIESLIQSFGSGEGSSSSGGRLKAHVIGVGQMSQSQAQSSEGPTGLLFLSDGMVQIPAILTASAWEHLQEQEDRECFTSLLNTTVCIQDYRLQFHMAPEQTRCRFFLSVGELVTTAAGPVKDNTPCCTTLSSVKLKICKTWRALLGQEEQDSQKSQCGFDLSELLGEWQHECLQAVLEDVRERLMMSRSRPVSPQPSTSTCNPLKTHPDTLTATSWDVDRIKYKGVKCFNVPMKCLLIPEEDASGLLTASEVRKTDLPSISKHSENTEPSVDDVDWRIAEPAVVKREHHTNENPPLPEEDIVLHEDTFKGIIDCDIKPLSNPWDIFPPPCETSSSSDASPEATPNQSLHSPTATKFTSEQPVILTSTQLSVHSSKDSAHSKGENSFLPPYQKLPLSTRLPSATACCSTSVSVSPPEPFTRPSNISPAADERRTHTAQPDFPALKQENQILDMQEETAQRKHRKAKRKRSEPTPEAVNILVEEEEAQISGSPPSWLFDTQTGPMAKKSSSSSLLQGGPVGTASRKVPTTHSDGRPFSYSYQVSGQNLTDLSRVKVSESLLHWAVTYLVVPKQTDNPHDTSVTSDHTSSSRTNVTSL